MANKLAQTQLDNKYPNQTDKDTEVKIDITKLNAGMTGTDKLTGDLVIENFPNVTEVELDGQELTKLKIVNCPELKKIKVDDNKLIVLDFEKAKVDSSGNVVDADKLTEVQCQRNSIREISFKHCSKLEKLFCQDNPHLDYFRLIENLKNLKSLNIGDTKIHLIHSEKLGFYKETAAAIKEIMGISPGQKLPKDSTGKLDIQALKNQIAAGADSQIPQLKSDKVNAENERDAAQANYNTAKTELDQLKQQLENIRKELGLVQNATEQQFLDKIKELMKRPSGPACTHTDYDTIKSERDSLKSDLEAKNLRISELENSNKNKENNNKDKDAITKKVLIDLTNNSLAKWGINASDEHKEKMQEAASAQGVEEVRSEIIKTELDKLKNENKSAFYLNLGLGALTIGSLLLLAWIMMRETNLPKPELEKKDQK